MLCDIYLWCYNSLKAKSGYTLDRLWIKVFILVCDTSALSTASLILPLGLRQACSLFVSSLKSSFFCLVLGAKVLSAASLLHPLSHTVCWHQAETASCCTRSWCICWWCVITSPSCWVLIRYSVVMSWSDSSGCDGSDRLLSETVWHSQSEALNECRHQPPAFPPPAVNTGFWLLPFYWPPICPACFLVS